MMLCKHFPKMFKVTPLLAAFLCFNESLLDRLCYMIFKCFTCTDSWENIPVCLSVCLFEKSWRTDINHVIVGPRYVMEYECLFNETCVQ